VTPIDRAVSILQAAGYRSLSRPLPVASTSFDFDAVLIAQRSLNLVVLIDTGIWDDERIRRQMQGLGRALDAVGSRLTLTAVLLGPEPRPENLEALTRQCRVLPVGTLGGSSQDRTLRDWLAVLLPLELPPPDEPGSNWRTVFEEQLAEISSAQWQQFAHAATRGKDAVEETLRAALQQALGNSWEN